MMKKNPIKNMLKDWVLVYLTIVKRCTRLKSFGKTDRI